MNEPLDIERLRGDYLNQVFDETEFELTAGDIVQFAASCGELTPRHTDPAHPDFRAPPTMVACLEPYNRLPDGFPGVDGMGMDAGRAVTVFKPVRSGVKLTGRTHVHAIYAKTGRSGRMVFFVKRMEIFDAGGERLACADTSTVIRERPAD